MICIFGNYHAKNRDPKTILRNLFKNYFNGKYKSKGS